MYHLIIGYQKEKHQFYISFIFSLYKRSLMILYDMKLNIMYQKLTTQTFKET